MLLPFLTPHIFHDSSVLLSLAAGLMFIIDLIFPWNLGGEAFLISQWWFSVSGTILLSFPCGSPPGVPHSFSSQHSFPRQSKDGNFHSCPESGPCWLCGRRRCCVECNRQQGGIIAGQENRLLVYEHIFQRLPDSFWVVGTDDRIRQVNQASCSLPESAGKDPS